MPEKIKNEPSQLTAFANTFAALGLSALLQPVITSFIQIGVKVAGEGKTYPTAFKELRYNTPISDLIESAKKTYKRRGVASITPAMFSQDVADRFELTKMQLLGFNTALETIISSTVFPEALERYRGKIGDNSANWKVFCDNRTAQFMTLGLRNASFVGAILSNDIGKSLVYDNKDRLAEYGISKDNAENALTIALRLTFAGLTSPFDRIFTQLSSGKQTAQEVGKEVFKDLAKGNLPKLCAGLCARTALVFTTSSTIAMGKKLGPLLVEALEENEVFKSIFSGEASRSLTKKKIDETADLISKDDFGLVGGSNSKVRKSSENCAKSIQEIIRLSESPAPTPSAEKTLKLSEAEKSKGRDD